MECNKDEAARAKEIAEKKVAERNYAGAKKFVLKARNLFPALEGLSQMLTTLDVYISADNKISGESDWYGILGVNPQDDDETIRKQYRKLALMLHPDKNKAVGAEGAFKLVSEAWGLLSDKNRRLAYNQKRNSFGFQHKAATKTAAPPAGATTNGYQNYKKNVRTHANNSRASFATAQPVRKNDTFWTICHKCKTHYEYMRMYLNHTLLCPNCHEAFTAVERDPPPNVFKQSNWSSRQSNSSAGHTSSSDKAPNLGKNLPNSQSTPGVSAGVNSFSETMFQWGPFSRGTAATSSAAAQAASVVQQASEKVKRQREERQSATEWERTHLFTAMQNPSSRMDRPLKKSNVENNQLNGYRGHAAAAAGMATGNGGFGTAGLHDINKGNFEASRIFGMSDSFIKPKPDTIRELLYPELRNMLTHKAKTKIQKVLQDWRASGLEGTANKENVNNKFKKIVKGDANEEGGEVSAKSITVPDSDFHNFDLDRTEDTFKEEQVWASYDDDDGMPRFYARIHKVISFKPFRMRISWLNSRSNSELGPIDWIGNGFTKTTGEFRIGKHEGAGGLNTFSHVVSWEKGHRGAIRIYPKKGEVWALYKNWSPDWDSETPGDVRHKYEMVKVVESFDEEQGVVSVALLEKVPGFKAVFRSQSDRPKEVRRIPKEELFRLSHQVPYHLLTGEEAGNAPKGCLELDPAATPLEIIEAENGRTAAQETSPNSEATTAMEIDSKTKNAEEAREVVRANGKQTEKDR